MDSRLGTAATPLDGPSPAPLSRAQRGVLRTLLYYDLFCFPLHLEELQRLSPLRLSTAECEAAVAALDARGLLRRQESFVLVGGPELVARRELAESRARAALPVALRRARLIARFPFVRAVAISGSLSKGVLGPGDDVDYFVVTAPGRVFACRGLLMAFKKVVLLDSHRFFCVNYLLAEDSLAVPDRNLFTATEVAWLRPVVGDAHYRALLDANPWVRDTFPGWTPPATDGLPEAPRGGLKGALERWLEGPWGDALDERVRRAVVARNRRRFRELPPEVFEVALRAERTASKHHPGHFQDRTLARHQEAVRAFEVRHGLSLALD